MMNILIVDDHQLIIDGVKLMLSREEDMDVVGETTQSHEALPLVKDTEEVDLVILDIAMPGKDGFEVTQEIKAVYPEVKILILSLHKKREFIQQLLDVGADGYILKNSDKSELILAIRTVMKSKKYLSDEVKLFISNAFSENGESHDMIREELSPREKEIARLITREKSTKEIAAILEIGIHTVNTHRKSILSKLDVKNVAGIIKYAYSSGLVKEF